MEKIILTEEQRDFIWGKFDSGTSDLKKLTTIFILTLVQLNYESKINGSLHSLHDQVNNKNTTISRIQSIRLEVDLCTAK